MTPEDSSRLSEDFAVKCRAGMDPDEPSLASLQASLLLVLASMAAGRGKRAHTLMGMLNMASGFW